MTYSMESETKMSEYAIDPALVAGNHQYLAGYEARHFLWQVTDGVATLYVGPDAISLDNVSKIENESSSESTSES